MRLTVCVLDCPGYPGARGANVPGRFGGGYGVLTWLVSGGILLCFVFYPCEVLVLSDGGQLGGF